MLYSFTQLSQFLSCPKRYRYRYIDGWKEKETRAGMLFGRAFETALAALFGREDAGAVLFEQWSAYESVQIEYSRGDTWKSMYEQGMKLLEQFAQDDRVEIRYPKRNLQVRVSKTLSATSEFVGYVDAFGYVDGRQCLIDWKTSGARFPEDPAGLVSLDPQLVCYSWLTGETEVALVVFVRKRLPEIQYLRCSISEKQRQEFAALVHDVVGQIEGGSFPPRAGIRFPQNTCTICDFVGLCLEDDVLTSNKLVRTGGGDLGWLDELEY